MENTQVLTSTTDSPEAVRAALGIKDAPPDPTPVVTPPAPEVPPVAAATPPPTDADPDPDPDVTASQAGRELSGRKGRLQARIDELTKEKYDSKREADEAKREAKELREKLEKMSAAPTPPAAGDPPPTPDVPETPPAPVKAAEPITGEDPADPKPKLDDFESVEDFTIAASEWGIRKQERRVKAQAAADKVAETEASTKATAEQERQKVLTKYFENRDLAKAKYPDWEDVMAKATIPIPPGLEFEIMSSPASGELLYYFANNAGELDEIINGSRSSGLRKLGVLEDRLMKASGAPATTPSVTPPAEPPAPATRPVPVSDAPEPVSTVGGGSTATSVPKDQMDYQTFKKLRNAEIAAAAGRK